MEPNHICYLFSPNQGGEEPSVNVDSGIMTFVNHGCKGSYNIGKETPFDEFTARLDAPCSEAADGRSHSGTTTFNPVVDRHLTFWIDKSIRDIKAGEEVLDNYLAFTCSNRDKWFKDVANLRAECLGEAVGEVTSYETERVSKK